MADLTSGQDVDILSAPTGSSAIQEQGNIAHDGVDAGNPTKMGMRAIAHGSNPTAVAAADRTDWLANRHGIPFVLGGHMNVITTEFQFTTSQSSAALVTVSSGTKIVVTRVSILNNAATTVNVGVRVGLAAASISTASSAGITGVVAGHGGLAPGSGIVEGNGGGILGIGADGDDLRITSDTPTSGSIRVIVSYFTIES